MAKLKFNILHTIKSYYVRHKNTLMFSLIGVLTAILGLVSTVDELDKHPICNTLLILITIRVAIPPAIAGMVYVYEWFRELTEPGPKISIEKLTGNRIYPDQHVKGVIHYRTYQQNTNLSERFVIELNPALQEIATLLNEALFARSKWTIGHSDENKVAIKNSFKNKLERNNSHIKRNSNTVLLVKDRSGNICGFSHVLPLTEQGFELYTEGLIADNTFGAHYIAKTGQKAHGLLIFSMGQFDPRSMSCEIMDYHRELLSDGGLELWKSFAETNFKQNIPTSHVLLHGIQFHIDLLIREHFSHTDEVPVIAQLDDEKLKKIFTGNNFRISQKHSKDACEIVRANLILA
jgi:hypothetical protein